MESARQLQNANRARARSATSRAAYTERAHTCIGICMGVYRRPLGARKWYGSSYGQTGDCVPSGARRRECICIYTLLLGREYSVGVRAGEGRVLGGSKASRATGKS